MRGSEHVYFIAREEERNTNIGKPSGNKVQVILKKYFSNLKKYPAASRE
jgi:hypothetical protein